MTKLSVNINKIATLRNARGQNFPNLVKVAKDLLDMGVRGLTVHPRPDGRHIKRSDVYDLARLVQEQNQLSDYPIEFNIEGFPSPDFIEMVLEVRPDQCTLVPDPPEAITSNAGWKMAYNLEILKSVSDQLQGADIRVSLFVDPFDLSDEEVEAIRQIGCARAELYTEAYAKAFAGKELESVLQTYKSAADRLSAAGIEVNAGHDLNLENLPKLIQHIPQLKEVSIGHALICEALYLGFNDTIARYHQILKESCDS